MYNVGITMNIDYRRMQYKKYSSPRPWMDIVVLDFGLNLQEALDIEKKIFLHCTSDKRSLNYKKYSSKVRESGYKKSSGGRKSGDDERIYCVYIAWCDARSNVNH